MGEVTDEFVKNDPKNQSLFSIMEPKKEYTIVILAMSYAEEDLEVKDLTQTIFVLKVGSDFDNDP